MSALCALDDLKLWMQIAPTLTSEDSLLSRLIDAVSADFLQAIKRPDLTPAANYTELRSGNGTQELFLYHWPINSITSLTIDDVAIIASPDGGVSDGYWLDGDPDPEQRMKLNLTGSCFTRRSRNRLFGLGSFSGFDNKNVKVVYNAGYAAVPADIVQAAIDWAAYRYKSRQWIGQSSKHMNTGETVSFLNWIAPVTTKAVIDKYMAPLFRDRQ